MGLDAMAVRRLVNELSDTVTGGRIDKISQPERDELVLGIRTFTDNYRLVLSASSSNPRVHFTGAAKKNPKTAPMFCMLLRKHIGGGKITSVTQEGFERIIKISVESYDELGDLTVKYLIIEIMGRHSNIILTDGGMKILDSIKRVDLTVSSVRQVLPGLLYNEPPAQDKIPLAEFDSSSPLDFARPIRADKAIMDAVSGISPIIAREAVHRALGRSDVMADSLNINQAAAVKVALIRFAEAVRSDNFAPCMISDASGKPVDFAAIDITQYGGAAKITPYESINALVDDFYSVRDTRERMKQKSADLTRVLNANIERAAKKLVILKKTLDDAQKRDKYKISGDLITANIYRINDGDSSVTVENYYEDGAPEITISLDPSLSPSRNAQRYYKKYTKAKTAQTEAVKQIAVTRAELDYLESALAALTMAETESDLNAVRAELTGEGYITRRAETKRRKKSETPRPLRFVSSDGFDIYVGRNNTQNDYLTLKIANSSDIWFHTKNIHGSHTVIKLGIDKNVPERTMREAAELAAYYSKARASAQVPVDYTRIKNVKKPGGAKPGMVIYDGYNTVYVTPSAHGELRQSSAD